jgi:hypothetical protein
MKHAPLAPTDFPESIHRQLNMYALAATAAGVGLLAVASPAEAKIIYTATHRVIAPNHSYNVDLNHDKITDFTIVNHVSACTDFCFFELRQYPADGNSAVGYAVGSGQFIGLALKPGARIGPRSTFKKGTAALAVARSNVYTSNKTVVYGPWVNVKDRYLGLKFQIEGKTHYGWARLNVKLRKTKITATLTGYAYETIPNKAIIAGKTKGPDGVGFEGSSASLTVLTPELDTLGLLALGSPRLSVWRRKDGSAPPDAVLSRKLDLEEL